MSAVLVSQARQRLLDAAVEAFSENGFGGTSTRDIASRAGRSPAAVYIHHESKEDLLYEISLQGHQEALTVLEAAAQIDGEHDARVWNMVYAFSLWHMENARLARVVQYELHALSEEHRTEVMDLRRRFHRVTAEALQCGVDAHAFYIDDIDAATRALLSLCIDFVRWFDPEVMTNADKFARATADLGIRMLNP